MLSAASLAGGAARGEDQRLRDELLEGGAITPGQHAELLAEQPTGPEDEDEAPAEAARAPDGEPLSLRLSGRLHVDWIEHRGDEPPARGTDGSELRRARLDIAGRLYEDWRFAAGVDFAGNEVSVKDFTAGYAILSNLTVTAGHQKQPFSLALEMSSNDLPFIERIDTALVSPFVDRAIGLRADASGERPEARARDRSLFGGRGVQPRTARSGRGKRPQARQLAPRSDLASRRGIARSRVPDRFGDLRAAAHIEGLHQGFGRRSPGARRALRIAAA